MIKNVIEIGFSRGQVFDVLSDYAAYEQWLPGCTRSVIVASQGNQTDVETTVEGIKTVRIEVRFDEDPERGVRFRMTKGTDLRAYAGEHRLMDAANGRGTVVITDVEIDIGIPIPQFMLDRVARNVVEEMGLALRERVMALHGGAATGGEKRSAGKKRRRRILQISNTPSGPRIWYLGKIYRSKD